MPRLSKIGAAALAAFGWTSGSAVSASYLVVAGGAGGGSRQHGGGGGAGGYRTGTLSLDPALSYTITVGAGGAGGSGAGNANNSGASGSNSVFSTITSAGGGGGGAYANSPASNAGNAGGSGGGQGGGTATSGGGAGNTPSTSPSQGNNGGAFSVVNGPGSGGGGAAAVGGNASGTYASGLGGNGGAGTASSITGSSVTYAGGGGGGGTSGSTTSSNFGTGGTGGGGAGNGTSGSANTGGGGGANSAISDGNGGTGGSGIVIISYAGAQQFGGGVVTSSGGNTIHTFTTSGTLVPVTPLSASYLVVAGGGAGGGNVGGGGGAGGLLSGSGLAIDSNSTYLVTVGAGGAAVTGANGGNSGTSSSFSMVSTAAVGGGGGSARTGGANTGGATGGSGGGGAGGSSGSLAGFAGTSGQGNTGGTGQNTVTFGGGGGGGAGAVGANATVTSGGNGGVGTSSSISGTATFYAGGGGGGADSASTTAGSGGNGGGGAGTRTLTAATAGTANTGGGGGGAGDGSSSQIGAAGGSGVVIISYPGSTQQMAGGTVTISGGNVIHTFTSTGYLAPLKYVNNSLRFRSSATAYLNRTPTVASNRRTWTWSSWVKRGTLTSSQYLFSQFGGTTYDQLRFDSDDTLQATLNNGTSANIRTSAVFRDPAAWYHLVFSCDTTNATANDRLQIWVNGVRQSLGTNTQPTQNYDTYLNTINAFNIGRLGSGSSYLDGYLTEINFIDGQALTPSSFGTFNSYGVWQPITYGGSYGTNGFYLPFTNTTSTTTLGYDFSPQGNNWTTNNISLTAGATYDSMTDVPTLTSATAANYPVFNPLVSSTGTFSSANLNVSTATTNATSTTIFASTGKWYWEVVCTSAVVANTRFGIVNTSGAGTDLGGNANGWAYLGDGRVYHNGASSSYGVSYATNDVLMIALDIDAGKIWYGKNGTWMASGVPSTGTSPSQTFTANQLMSPAVSSGSGTFAFVLNCGQRPFSYTPPTGFVALNTFNL